MLIMYSATNMCNGGALSPPLINDHLPKRLFSLLSRSEIYSDTLNASFTFIQRPSKLNSLRERGIFWKKMRQIAFFPGRLKKIVLKNDSREHIIYHTSKQGLGFFY